ncbi:MAG: hypothetical protein ACRDUY_16080 [Nitriliruptorales bacterium]
MTGRAKVVLAAAIVAVSVLLLTIVFPWVDRWLQDPTILQR